MADRKMAEVFPPGEFIKEELEARGWSQIDLSEIIGRQPNVVNEIVMGKRSITPETAKALGEAFGTTAQIWMNLETAYQLWKSKEKDTDKVIARRAKLYEIAPIKELTRRHWIEPSENIEVLEKRVMNFFEINDLESSIALPYAARKSSQSVTASHWAWIHRVRRLARMVDAKPFSEQSFKNGLVQLRNLLVHTQEIRHVPRILADAGIRFLVLEHLPQTRIDGVTLWVNKSPVIALSLRFDRIDAFWYTLAHELGHVKQRDGLKGGLVIDTDLVREEHQVEEQLIEAEELANRFATDFLVDQEELNDFILRVHPLYGKQKIMNFAERIKVHPGIIVGQLQHRNEIPWSSFRPMLEKVRHVIVPSSLTDGWGQLPPSLKEKEMPNAYTN
ncbi:MAG: HigA family addiction module antidote protein [Syntrophorhabdus sp.]|nr:HigA family addiction module antidote protein [Syntrophorhabdus sp.]